MSLTLTRRTALKSLASLAASALVPTIRLRPELEPERLLARFCADDSPYTRYELDRPFRLGSLTYATDARWICRAELPGTVLDGGDRVLPPVESLWPRIWRPAGPWQDFELPAIESLRLQCQCANICPACGDRRIFYGAHYPATQEEMDALPGYCIDTNTYRDRSCGLCGGGDYQGPSLVRIGRVAVDYTRLKTVAMIPGVRVVPSQLGSGDECLLFSGGGFDGAVMGVHTSEVVRSIR